jgi:hypothetical protein
MPKGLLVLAATALAALTAASPGLSRTESGLAPTSGSRVCRQPADLDKLLASTRAQGFAIAPGAVRALKSLPVPTPAPVGVNGRDPARVHVILVGTKGTPRTLSRRQGQSARRPAASRRIAVSDHASLGCPVGAPAHVVWDSGYGAVSEVWRWATIGGQVGSTVGPAEPNCGYTTCRWYAWINGVQNRYYRSVDVYNGIYAFIDSAGCYY